ncbi:MAG TPA: ATP-binding protein [Steroidobacter sp.]|uniref:ATP-binding protein n=1 Tax=Steroidobacter sp. TaxID=1978227 RepID=UPI002EDA0591
MSGKVTWNSDHAGSAVRIPTAAASLALCGLLYYLAAGLELALRLPDSTVAALSPQQGVLVALLMTTRYRRWWLIALPVLPAHLAAYWDIGVPPWQLAWQAAHTIVLTIGIVAALRWLGIANPFESLREFLLYLLVILLGPALLNIGSPGVALATGANLDLTTLTWQAESLSSALGILTWGSCIILGLLFAAGWPGQHTPARYIEALLVAAALSASCYLTIGAASQQVPLVLVFVPLLWLAIRFGSTATAVALALVATFAAAAAQIPQDAVVDLQMFLIVLAFTSLVVAVLGEERQREAQTASARATLAKRQSDERISLILRAARDAPHERDIPHDTDAALRTIGTMTDRSSRKDLRTNRNLERFASLAMVGQITASIAHEINQPLAAIHHNAEAGLLLLAGRPVDRTELQEIFNDIRGDNRRAVELIDQLRELMQEHELRLDPIDINEVVGDVVELLRVESRRRHIQLEARYAKLPVLLGDYVRLQQVLLNLILNAMDAMEGLPESRRRIVIHTSRSDATHIQVRVVDRGKGIDPDNLPKIFDSFFTSKQHGMGIGLAIARSIVEAHGGRIWARNNADMGATLAFEIDSVGSKVMMPYPGPTDRYGARLN